MKKILSILIIIVAVIIGVTLGKAIVLGLYEMMQPDQSSNIELTTAQNKRIFVEACVKEAEDETLRPTCECMFDRLEEERGDENADEYYNRVDNEAITNAVVGCI